MVSSIHFVYNLAYLVCYVRMGTVVFICFFVALAINIVFLLNLLIAQLPILSTSHCEVNSARSCTHARKTIYLAPIHPFTKQMVPSLCPESLTRSLSKLFSPVFRMCLIKGFLPSITFLHTCHFFLSVSLFHFHRTLSWACESLHEPRKFISFCAFT